MYTVDKEKERKEILKRYKNLLKVCGLRTSSKNKHLIRKAFNFANEAHKNVRRMSGEPYIYHPLEVARICGGEIGLGTVSIISALLHDVVEDTDYTLDDIKVNFGEKVEKIVDGLTKIKDIVIDENTTSEQAENFKKMLLTLSDDVRVILIKLADRLHNMRTLDSMPLEKQLKIASETTFLYAPLANRLGLFSIKNELEDLSLKYTEPVVYKDISEKLKDTKKKRIAFVNSFIYPIKKALTEDGIKYRIIKREKAISSIWDKMKKKEIPFDDIYDIFAIRIIIDSTLESERANCWRVYSIITKIYRPNPNRLRDWISVPKSNGYKALHITVMSKTGRWVEIQIRTERMNDLAERGYAAHWKYKELTNQESGIDDWLKKINEQLKIPEKNAVSFVDDFKLNLYTSEIVVFTPKGECKTLPKKSTVLDFAYNIHSEIGEHCIGAKVNHKLAPINHQLESGDQVEIITSKKQEPKPKWFDYVITARAKYNIKEAINKEKKKYFKEGEEKLEKYYKHLNIEYNKSNIYEFQKYIHSSNLVDLYYNIAINKIRLKDLKSFNQQNSENNIWVKYIKNPFSKSKYHKPSYLSDSIIDQIKNKANTLLLKGNTEDFKYTISSCCNPIPGDDVIGLISPDKTIEIHRINCPNAIKLMSEYGNNIVKVRWTNKESISFLTGVKIVGINKLDLINNLAKVIISDFKLNIKSVHIESNNKIIEGNIMLFVHDTKNLNKLIDSLKKVKGLQKVHRIY